MDAIKFPFSGATNGDPVTVDHGSCVVGWVVGATYQADNAFSAALQVTTQAGVRSNAVILSGVGGGAAAAASVFSRENAVPVCGIMRLNVYTAANTATGTVIVYIQPHL